MLTARLPTYSKQVLLDGNRMFWEENVNRSGGIVHILPYIGNIGQNHVMLLYISITSVFDFVIRSKTNSRV